MYTQESTHADLQGSKIERRTRPVGRYEPLVGLDHHAAHLDEGFDGQFGHAEFAGRRGETLAVLVGTEEPHLAVGAAKGFQPLERLDAVMQAGGRHVHRNIFVLRQFRLAPFAVLVGDADVAIRLVIVKRQRRPIHVFHNLKEFKRFLSNDRTAVYRSRRFQQHEFAHSILAHEDHTVRLDSFERTGFEIDEHQHLPTDQLLGRIMFGDARHDLTPVDTRVDSQLQQLLGLGDLLGRKNGRNTYIHALEI